MNEYVTVGVVLPRVWYGASEALLIRAETGIHKTRNIGFLTMISIFDIMFAEICLAALISFRILTQRPWHCKK